MPLQSGDVSPNPWMNRSLSKIKSYSTTKAREGIFQFRDCMNNQAFNLKICPNLTA